MSGVEKRPVGVSSLCSASRLKVLINFIQNSSHFPTFLVQAYEGMLASPSGRRPQPPGADPPESLTNHLLVIAFLLANNRILHIHTFSASDGIPTFTIFSHYFLWVLNGNEGADVLLKHIARGGEIFFKK